MLFLSPVRSTLALFSGALLLACLFIGEVRGQSMYETKSGTVTFTSEVPTHTFSGTSDQLVGRINLADSTVDFYVDLHTLETGIDKRDQDMLETLHAEEHPFAEFYGTLVSDPALDSGRSDSVTVEGEFSVNGASRTVQIDGVLERTGEGLRLEADWTLRLADYDIEPPGILFYRVDEEQDISIQAHLTPVSDS